MIKKIRKYKTEIIFGAIIAFILTSTICAAYFSWKEKEARRDLVNQQHLEMLQTQKEINTTLRKILESR